jgi:hypothetical protein
MPFTGNEVMEIMKVYISRTESGSIFGNGVIYCDNKCYEFPINASLLFSFKLMLTRKFRLSVSGLDFDHSLPIRMCPGQFN